MSRCRGKPMAGMGAADRGSVVRPGVWRRRRRLTLPPPPLSALRPVCSVSPPPNFMSRGTRKKQKKPTVPPTGSEAHLVRQVPQRSAPQPVHSTSPTLARPLLNTPYSMSYRREQDLPDLIPHGCHLCLDPVAVLTAVVALFPACRRPSPRSHTPPPLLPIPVTTPPPHPFRLSSHLPSLVRPLPPPPPPLPPWPFSMSAARPASTAWASARPWAPALAARQGCCLGRRRAGGTPSPPPRCV